MYKRDEIQKILIDFSEGEICINKATNDILALFNVVDSEAELCRCHDPMTHTNIMTGDAECYYCGGRRQA